MGIKKKAFAKVCLCLFLSKNLFISIKSIHNSGPKNLVIWHHKKLFYLFYVLTLQNIQL